MHPNIIHIPFAIDGPGQHYYLYVSPIQPNTCNHCHNQMQPNIPPHVINGSGQHSYVSSSQQNTMPCNHCPNQMKPNIPPHVIDGPGQHYYLYVPPIQPNTCNHCHNQMQPNIPPHVINGSGQHSYVSSSQQNTMPCNHYPNQMGYYPTLDQHYAMPQGQPSSSVKYASQPPAGMSAIPVGSVNPRKIGPPLRASTPSTEHSLLHSSASTSNDDTIVAPANFRKRNNFILQREREQYKHQPQAHIGNVNDRQRSSNPKRASSVHSLLKTKTTSRTVGRSPSSSFSHEMRSNRGISNVSTENTKP